MKAPPIWKPVFFSLTQKASNRKVILNIDARTSIEKSHKTEFRGSQEIFKFFKFRSRLFPSICSKILFYKRPYYKIYLNLIYLSYMSCSIHKKRCLWSRYQKVCFIIFISKLHKRNMESFSLCNGDKTHEVWKPLLNTLHAFGGLSECFAQWNLQYFFCAIC